MNGILLSVVIACFVIVLACGSYIYELVCKWIARRHRRGTLRRMEAQRDRAEAECETLRAENAKLRRTLYVMRADSESRIEELESALAQKDMLLAQKWAGSRKEA